MMQVRRWASLIALTAGLALAGAAAATEPPASPAAVAGLASQAYLYALPLVITDVTREASLGHGAAIDARPNHFYHVPVLGDANFRTVIRPNVDTLYSSAWLDLRREPVVLTVPSSHGRYFVVQCMDAWTNVFFAPGVRTLGDQAGTYVVVGPHWTGPTPAGLKVVRSPTNTVWVLGRTYVRDPADLAAARTFQKSLDVRPLSQRGDPAAGSAFPQQLANPPKRPDPIDIVRAMDAKTFFARFEQLTVDNPPAALDAEFIRNTLAPLGLDPSHPIAWADLPPATREALASGEASVLGALVDRSHVERNRTAAGWAGMPGDVRLGDYRGDYRTRAVVAVFGLGANLTADAVYLNASVDAHGQPLDGNRAYTLTFAPGRTPPVRGFWSLTAYDVKGYLVANPANRYALKQTDRLQFGPDGSLTLYVQPDDPGPAHRANWLPTPRGAGFAVSLRNYWPDTALLNGGWTAPGFEPVR